jgi:hypothetical protein
MTQQGFLIFHYKTEDDAHRLWKRGRGYLGERPLSSNCGTLTLFSTRIKSQKCLHGFVSKGYLISFGMKQA